MKYKKIALIGMMGAGKSSIARLLCAKTNLQIYDTDSIFESTYNITISDYFKKYSEAGFRKKESQILKQIVNKREFILSTGGGVILNEINRKILFDTDIFTIFLKASSKTIYNRLKNDTKRPLLQKDNPQQEISKIIAQREKYYSKANYVIDTDNKTKEEIVGEILWIISK